MVTFEAGPVRIRRPAEEVFAYISNVDRHAEWSNAVVESKQEGFGQVGKGTRFRERLKFLGRTVDGLSEVSAFEPNQRVEFRSLSGPMPNKWDVVLQQSDGVTVLTSHGEAEPGGLFKLASPMMRGALRRQAENDFRTLKAIVEEQA